MQHQPASGDNIIGKAVKWDKLCEKFRLELEIFEISSLLGVFFGLLMKWEVPWKIIADLCEIFYKVLFHTELSTLQRRLNLLEANKNNSFLPPPYECILHKYCHTVVSYGDISISFLFLSTWQLKPLTQCLNLSFPVNLFIQ